MIGCGRFIAISAVATARAARHDVEAALDGLGDPWPWHPGASRVIDFWLAVEERE